jgi:hypothetical protein
MRRRLKSLGFSFTSDADSLIGKFAAAQNYRKKNKESESAELTRTSALAVVLFETPAIRRSLASFGLDYNKFLAEVGLSDFPFRQGSKADVDLFFSLDEAIAKYVHSEDAILQTSTEVFAIVILEDVARIFSERRVSHYQLEGVLTDCGLDIKKLSTALRSRSLPFDHRRPSLSGDGVARSTASASSSENGDLSSNLGGSPPEHQPEVQATTPFYSDHPAQRDLLNRKAVAETIATMIESVWREDDREQLIDRSFIVHLHGRWGSGKTSILNFLSEALLRTRTGEVFSTQPPNPAWVIVNYNAWRNQSLGPVWWTLMESVYTQARDQFGGWFSAKGKTLILRDRWWRIRSSHAPLALTTIAIVAIVLWLSWVLKTDLFAKDKSWFSEGLTAIASSIGIVVAIFTFGQTYRIGSARTARSYLELSRDPVSPLIKRYSELIDDIRRPVAVFIDDLDRCNGEFVVELLQTIQTLFRNAKVLYVVAADRDWVCSSYQQQYAKFSDSLGEPGKSLGHLFVEKVFQLSVEVPRLAEVERDAYWDQLINARQLASRKETEAITAQIIAELEGANTEAAIGDVIDRYRSDPDRADIAAAQAFKRLHAAPLVKAREHFLMRYNNLIEPNPRAMKLLRELRQRIVARAHDHDAIAGTGQLDQAVAAGAAVRKGKGLSAAPFDFADDVAAADAAVDRAAEIDRLGHDQNVLVVQPAPQSSPPGRPSSCGSGRSHGAETSAAGGRETRAWFRAWPISCRGCGQNRRSR